MEVVILAAKRSSRQCSRLSITNRAAPICCLLDICFLSLFFQFLREIRFDHRRFSRRQEEDFFASFSDVMRFPRTRRKSRACKMLAQFNSRQTDRRTICMITACFSVYSCYLAWLTTYILHPLVWCVHIYLWTDIPCKLFLFSDAGGLLPPSAEKLILLRTYFFFAYLEEKNVKTIFFGFWSLFFENEYDN